MSHSLSEIEFCRHCPESPSSVESTRTGVRSESVLALPDKETVLSLSFDLWVSVYSLVNGVLLSTPAVLNFRGKKLQVLVVVVLLTRLPVKVAAVEAFEVWLPMSELMCPLELLTRLSSPPLAVAGAVGNCSGTGSLEMSDTPPLPPLLVTVTLGKLN